MTTKTQDPSTNDMPKQNGGRWSIARIFYTALLFVFSILLCFALHYKKNYSTALTLPLALAVAAIGYWLMGHFPRVTVASANCLVVFCYAPLFLLVADQLWLGVPVLLFVLMSIFFLDAMLYRHWQRRVAATIKIGIVAWSIVAVAAMQIVDVIGSRELRRVVTTAQAQNYPLIAETASNLYPPVAEADNGGPLAIACATSIDHILKNESEKCQPLPYLGDVDAGTVVWNEDLQQRSEEVLAACSRVLPALEQALSFPKLQNKLQVPRGIRVIELPLPHLQSLQNTHKLLALQSFYWQKRGESGKAVASAVRIFRLAEVLRDEPLLISQLVYMAGQNIGTQAVRHLLHQEPQLLLPLLKEMQQAMVPALAYGRLARGIPGEMLLAYSVIDDEHLLPYAPWSLIFGNPSLRSGGFLWPQFLSKGWVKWDIATLLTTTMQMHKMLTQTEAEVMAQLQSVPQPVASFATPMTSMMVPAWHGVAEREFRKLAVARCVYGAVCVRAFRQQQGDYPASLAALAREERAHLYDPFAGKELQYQLQDNSFKVASIGPKAKTPKEQAGDAYKNMLREMMIELAR